jgi:predicted secreted hydrolase
VNGVRRGVGLVLGAVALAALVALAFGLEERARRPRDLAAALSVAEALGGAADARFARAESPREFSFPADHGPHDGFRSEWWYVTANLFASDGRAFGAQLTFFRNALAPPAAMPASASRFRDPHVWMAHFALSDERAGRFRFAERFAREGTGLAGATATPFAVHVEGWRIASNGEAFAPLHLEARDGDFAIELDLAPAKPVVLQGEAGLSRKGPEAGNASYYYSIPRLAARGTVEIAGRALAVEGEAWLDREWSTSALGPDLAGWDWFALQLDDGRELMFYRLRRNDGGADPLSRGSLVERDGSSRPLLASEVELTALSTWTNRRGTGYPSRWRLAVPGERIELELRPRLEDQELALTVRYWEGAVTVAGTSRGAAVAGHGFVELAGYETPPGRRGARLESP